MELSWERITDLLTIIFENSVTQIILGGLIILTLVLVLKRVVRSVLSRSKVMETKESDTVISLINSIINYIGLIGFLFFVLSVFGLNIGSMLAGAGVLGIVIGFGAQSLVQDLLAGVFIVYEKQLQKGDWVIVNSTHEGLVEEIGFRMLKIRAWSGTIISINNGQVQTVENFNKDKMRIIETITTSFYEDPERVTDVLTKACEELNAELHEYLRKDLSQDPIEPFRVIGMASLNDNYRGYSYMIAGLIEDLTFFPTSRAVRGIIAKYLYKYDIKMPEQQVRTRQDNHPSSE
ncbi:small conductance mechanosensitive channel [Pelagirhabdus alkalitolerans]|uniref:Small conductance mechanosensitive channel n=1 Tax=Pelagirhabdus alkalitolerans TaxID=1612202 RepID=A0A1G6IJI1_9BACI|nr:mechanosensitive ion channel family protein [Pelagirhabdus alkalitolerans]SDC05876.1 small conductance mechanosensitive channel [Pelagirhabdus alkalitolerans]